MYKSIAFLVIHAEKKLVHLFVMPFSAIVHINGGDYNKGHTFLMYVLSVKHFMCTIFTMHIKEKQFASCNECALGYS